MLTNPSKAGRLDLLTDLDSIDNYYENLVFQAIQERLGEQLQDADYIADVACVALNHLPPRYIRHHVDMAFYLSPNERQEMLDKVNQALDQAIDIVSHSDNYRQDD